MPSKRKPKPPDWQRTAGSAGGTCGASWRHVSGAVIHHCGHPTALYPYYGFKANGQPILYAGCKCFAHLHECQITAIEP